MRSQFRVQLSISSPQISDIGFEIDLRSRISASPSDFGPQISDPGVGGRFTVPNPMSEVDSRSRIAVGGHFRPRNLLVASSQNPVLEPFRAQNHPFWTLNRATSRRVTGVTDPLQGLPTFEGLNQPPDSDPKWFSIRLPC